MGWFVDVSQANHPCWAPDEDEKRSHRVGEFWRCEVCGDLWQLRVGVLGRSLSRVDSWWTRWKLRKMGYTDDKVS